MVGLPGHSEIPFPVLMELGSDQSIKSVGLKEGSKITMSVQRIDLCGLRRHGNKITVYEGGA